MKYLSLFSGIEACTVAWEPLGWEPVAFCEFDRFPSAVLAHHYPDVPNLGDVTKITDEQIEALGPIDIVVGGSPCQDLSVAGKRKGLAGARSGLFHEQLRIFHAARHLCGARWLLWENVPGAFSSHGGRDFAVVVGEMAGLKLTVPEDGWGTEGMAVGSNGLVEWCVLDAQWFGVAQRRRRVFALLDAGDWTDRPPVLLEPDGLRGDSAPSRETGERVTGSLAARTRGGGGLGTDLDCVDGNQNSGWSIAVAFAQNQRDEVRTMDVAGALAGEPGMKQQTYVAQPPAVAMRESGQGYWMQDDTAGTFRAEGEDRPSRPSHVISQAMQVRRLTPRECERLQGFPDDYTLIPWRGKPADKCPDGPRYKALGNSMAVPVMRWIGRQIQRATDSGTGSEP
jgi:DNA (cytosine-5)-methyltransferase 1